MAKQIFQDTKHLAPGVPGAVFRTNAPGQWPQYGVDLGNGTYEGPYVTLDAAQARGNELAQQDNAAMGSGAGAGSPSDIVNTSYNGTPQEQQDYNDQQAWAAAGRDPSSTLFGFPANFTRNGKPLIQTLPQPGRIGAANRADAALLNEVRGNAAAHNSAIDAAIAPLGPAYATADAQDAATRDQELADLAAIGLGPSMAASAQADPQAIAAQQQAIAMLMGAANGSLDVHTNPEDLARQEQAAGKLWDLTDPEVTAKERYLMEVARAAEERDRRGAMDAALRNLAARGQLGSGAEIGAMLGAGQTTSQNRMMQDLGTQAGAVDRAMQAMGLYSNLATSMRNASDAIATGNSNRRVSAGEAAGGLAGQERGQSFNESYQRGSAADAREQAQADLGLKKAGMGADARTMATDRTTARANTLAGTNIAAADSKYGANTDVTNLEGKQNASSWDRDETALKAILEAAWKGKSLKDNNDAIRFSSMPSR